MNLTYAGGGNPRSQISAMIRQIEGAGGGSLTIVGAHVVDGTINEAATNLDIYYGDGGGLTLGDNLPVPVIKLYPAVPFTGRLRMFAPRIDCSAGQYVGGTLSSSAICADYYARFEVYDCELFGGQHWQDGRADSGISPVGCMSVLINSGWIRGFSDLAIYITGDGSMPAHDELATVKNISIKDCRQGIDSKRGYKRVVAQKVGMTDVDVPYRMSWVGNESNGGVPIRPGIRMDVTGGTVRDAKIAFQPEGPGIMSIDRPLVIASRELLARNQGAALKGRVRVEGNRKIVSESLKAGGVVYKPTTALKVELV